MAIRWSIDLGTTNSVVAAAEGGSVRVLHLPEITRVLPTEQQPLVPTAVHVADGWQRFLWLFKRPVRDIAIGQKAVSRNLDGRSPCFAQSFKRYLGNESHRCIIRTEREEVTVRDAVRYFLGGVIEAIRKETGEKVEDLTIPAPVAYFETYRAELREIATALGVKRFRSLDEPVAAGLGYGVQVGREENLLVVDFGGGTLNLAAVQLGAQAAETGNAPVLAKHMVFMGGDDVDRWLTEHLAPREVANMADWDYDLRWQVMQLKEQVSRSGAGEIRWRGIHWEMNREQLRKLLEERGLYRELRAALDDIRAQLAVGRQTIDEVLIVGGSTQLPDVAATVDDAFPEAVVRHDPEYLFTGVAIGAARHAGGVTVEDFIYHDYALAVQNDRTGTVEYELLIPGRTRYPTSRDFAVRYYADYPGMQEMRISICEIGRLGQRPVGWEQRPNGSSYWAPKSADERGMVVELNPADPALPLQPVGRGTSPRLRVTYEVNSDRWMCITAEDLVAKKTIRDRDPVVRLR